MARKPSIKTYPHHVKNPFITDLVEDFSGNSSTFKKTVVTTPKALNKDSKKVKVIEKDGSSTVVFQTTKYVDTEEFVKVYRGHIRLFHSLSVSDLDLVEYAVSQLQNGVDTVFLYPLLIAPILGVSKQTIYCSLAVLLERGLLAKAEYSDKYFVNPTLLFKGDRISVIVNAIKKS